VATNDFQGNDPTEASQLLPTPHMYHTPALSAHTTSQISHCNTHERNVGL
jgi:hypothetical protein